MRPVVVLVPVLAALGAARGQQLERFEQDVSTLEARLQEETAPRLGLVRSAFDPDAPELDFGPNGAWFTAYELGRWAGHAGGDGGTAVVHRGRLVAEVSPEGRQRLAAGLAAMRAEARRAVSLTLELVALGRDEERALRGGAGVALDPEALAALERARRAGGRLASHRLLARDGERVAEAQLLRTSFLGDREVDSSGVVSILHPVVEELLAGCAAELALSTVPGEEGRWDLDARVERCDLQSMREVEVLGGKLQLPSVAHLGLAVSLRLGAGETVLLGAARVPAADPRLKERTLAIVCRADPAAIGSPVAPPTGVHLRRYSLQALLGPRDRAFQAPGWGVHRRSLDGGDGCVIELEEEEEPLQDRTPDELADRVMSEAAQGSWEDPDSGCWVEARGRGLIVAQTPEGHASVAAYLRREAATRFLQHELLLLAAPEAKGGEDLPHVIDPARWDALVAAHALEERLLLCGQGGQRVEGVLRREVRVVAGVQPLAEEDLQNKAIRVDDPVVDTVGVGTRLSIRARRGDDGFVALELAVDLRDAGQIVQVEGLDGAFERHEGARHVALTRTAELAPGQGLLWEVGAGAERKLLLVRSRSLEP